MAIAENSYPHKMGSSYLQVLDPKTWHAHPRMQTWQVPPGKDATLKSYSWQLLFITTLLINYF